jgi:hypothetical protein
MSDPVQLLKKAVIVLYDYDPEFVEGGCFSVSHTLVALAMRRGYKARVVYGNARRPGGMMPHAGMG